MARQMDQEKAAFWKTHVENHASGGLTRKKYCEENQIKEHCLIYWRRRLTGKSEPAKNRFVPVKVRSEQKPLLLLKVGNGISLEFSEAPDPRWLGQMLRNVTEV